MSAPMPSLTIGPIGQAQVEAFALASGDANPLHVSPSIAREIGLEGAPVHGMLLVAFLHEAVRRHCPQGMVASLATRFMAPVFVGDTIEISGRIVKTGTRDEPVIMRLFVKTNRGAVACMAEATIAPSPGGWTA